ncbi:MAG: carboxylating nicotinate-nucleotide diphosphorylase [Candidatus Omnitrophota bacterium]
MNYVKKTQLEKIVKSALREDTGKKDITTELIIPENKSVKAVLLAKEDCLICGLEVALLVFKAQDKNIKFKPLVQEGSLIKKGKIIAYVSGKAKNILAAERVALNFLSLLSGIATTTRKYVKAVKPFEVKILDTRKTIPGLRLLEKYAVRTGGGFNHRLSLDEMVLVKDNHLKVIGGLKKLPKTKTSYKVEIEVKSLKEFKGALGLKPDIIMLDNMNIETIKKAAKIRGCLPLKLEVSGGITLKNVKRAASTGVDMISIGALTHSVNSVDMSLEIL